jgi:hypothetical protein
VITGRRAAPLASPAWRAHEAGEKCGACRHSLPAFQMRIGRRGGGDVTPERLARTKAKVDELAAAFAGRSAPAKRMAARAVARRIRVEDFPNRGCRVIWAELMQSRPEPGSTAEVDAADLRHIAPSWSTRCGGRWRYFRDSSPSSAARSTVVGLPTEELRPPADRPRTLPSSIVARRR